MISIYNGVYSLHNSNVNYSLWLKAERRTRKPGTEKAGIILHVRNIVSFQHFFVVFDNSKQEASL